MKTYHFWCLLLIPIVCSSQNVIVTGQTDINLYTDIPDVTISHSNPWNGYSNKYDLKLNNVADNGWDVGFECAYIDLVDTNGIHNIIKLNELIDANYNIEYAISGSVSEANVTPFPEGATIPDDLPLYNSWWNEDGTYMVLSYIDSNFPDYCVCDWDSIGIAYLAFRARTNSDPSDESLDTVYGWIRIKSTAYLGDPTITVYDWAVNGIISGNDEIQKETRHIFPNPATDKVRVVGLTNEKIFNVTDITGKTLKVGSIKEKPLEINLNTFPPGLYLLLIDGNFIGKIVKSQ